MPFLAHWLATMLAMPPSPAFARLRLRPVFWARPGASGGAHHGGEALVFHADGCGLVLIEVLGYVEIGLTFALGVPAFGALGAGGLVSLASLGALLFALGSLTFFSDVPVGEGFFEVEDVAVGEGEVILDSVVAAFVGGEGGVGEVRKFRVVVCYGDVQVVAATMEGCIGGPAAVLDFDEMECPDVVGQWVLGVEYGINAHYLEGTTVEGFDEP